MLSVFVLCALSSLTVTAGSHSGAAQPSSAEPKKLTTGAAAAEMQRVPPEKLREDFRILHAALEEGHPGIYRYTPKEELDKRFDRAERALDRPMNVYEFYRVVAPAVAGLKCGHTAVRVNPDLDKGRRVFPLLVRVLESGGGYYGNTSGPGMLLVLPNTKLQAYVPLMTDYMAVRGYKSASRGVLADCPVSYTVDELLAGKDKELELALGLARCASARSLWN